MTEQHPPQFVPPQPTHTQTPPAQNQSKDFPIASLVLGIVSLLGAGIFAGIPAIIFGAIALKRKQPSRGMSIAGVITGSISVVLSLLFIAFMVFVVNITNTNDYKSEPSPFRGDSRSIEDPQT
ncbi:hypothetical protein D3C86_965570 [compost metagenome]